jgi:hypothetical protein
MKQETRKPGKEDLEGGKAGILDQRTGARY